jgi:hypothetical protein
MWRRLLAIALLAAAVVVAWRLITSAPPSTTTRGRSNDDRIAAMLSVHANARWPGDPHVPGRFIPLDAAVRILASDEGRDADSRRRRAVAKLAGYALERGDPVEWAHLAPRLAALGADPAAIKDFVSQRFPQGSASPEALEAAVAQLTVGMTPECPWEPIQQTKHVHDDPPPIEWTVEYLVPREPPPIARALDPQSWAQCSKFFRRTYLAELADPNAVCCPYDEKTSTCSTKPDQSTLDPYDPVAAAKRPAGKPYKQVPLFEEFCEDAEKRCGECYGETNDCDVAVENLLCTHTWYEPAVPFSLLTPLAHEYHVTFRKAVWLFTEFFGAEQEKITKDDGELYVRRATNEEMAGKPGTSWSFVHVHKDLDFGSSLVGGSSGEVIKALQDELAGEVAELACCEVPKETWTTIF